MSTKAEEIAVFQRTTGPIFMFKSQMTGSTTTNQMLQLNPAQKVQTLRQSDCQTPALRLEKSASKRQAYCGCFAVMQSKRKEGSETHIYQ